MTPAQEERMATLEQLARDHDRRLMSLETIAHELYAKFDRYLPRYVTAVAAFGSVMLGGCFVVIAQLLVHR